MTICVNVSSSLMKFQLLAVWVSHILLRLIEVTVTLCTSMVNHVSSAATLFTQFATSDDRETFALFFYF